ncbi:MAG: tetratricopeptide repeat protein [Flavobacterium sp.]|uniref:tetratricopeptide repeat protein n=1 Tax=Flavobacterium sp. TaxID=239 RepID=UPI003263E45A
MKHFKKVAVITLIVFFSQLNLFSQEKEISKEILDQSCACIGKLNFDLTTAQKNDSIKSCITSSIIAKQTKEFVAQMTTKLDSLKGDKINDTILKNASFQITIDKDYDEIEKKLLADCPYVKQLIMTNNEKNKNSISNKKKAMAFYEEGDKYFNQGKYDLALVEYNKAVTKDPKFAFAWDNMGICYRKLNRFKEAIECYKKSLELDPEGVTPLMSMAVAYNLLNQNKEAIETYNKFIKLHPDNPEGFYGISRLQNVTGDYDNALESALKAYDLYDKGSSPYKQDAINVMKEIVANLKKEGKIDIFNTFAEKYGLTKIKE